MTNDYDYCYCSECFTNASDYYDITSNHPGDFVWFGEWCLCPNCQDVFINNNKGVSKEPLNETLYQDNDQYQRND